jgi:hypothetical protein
MRVSCSLLQPFRYLLDLVVFPDKSVDLFSAGGGEGDLEDITNQ